MEDTEEKRHREVDEDHSLDAEELVNASGHVQELDRNFGLFSICAIALISDDAWAAGAGSLVLAYALLDSPSLGFN